MTTLSPEQRLLQLWYESDRLGRGSVLEGRGEDAYSEDAFRYFLDLERKRADRSGRPLLLLLVNLKADDEINPRIPAPMAARLFAGLRACIRDVDFLGWYRHERVAGAVLTQGPQSTGVEASDQIVRRVTNIIGEYLPHAVSRLRVRVLHAPEQLNG